MSRKTLRFNRFGDSILSEYNLFYYSIGIVHQKYPNNTQNNPDVYQVEFNWTWNGYDGYGEIDFYKSTSTLCKEFGENFSNMTVSSHSKKQQSNGRSNCALYNDSSLIKLFELMLSKINLANTISHSEWIARTNK